MLALVQIGENPKREYSLAYLTVALLLLLFTSGCAMVSKHSPPDLSGSFSGTTLDGESAKITVSQKSNTIMGRGRIGAVNFSVSGITSFHAPVLLFTDEGETITGSIILSPNGREIIIEGLDNPVTLQRSDESVRPLPGPFSGKYVNKVLSTPIWLDLTQYDELLSGIGYYRERPVAVAGKINGSNEAHGNLLFSDESQTRVQIKLSDDKKILSIIGFGAPLELFRK